jgi:hypothetical protein
MDKSELIKKLEDLGSTPLVKEKVLGWVRCLPGTSSNRNPVKFKRGDVCMHSVFNHPYVLLRETKEGWICVLLTSEEKCPEILEKTTSRFFDEAYFTKCVLTMASPTRFMNPFENPKQINSIEKKLKELFG